jgi:hypothetical protein
MTANGPPSGWYPDPTGAGLRSWDGTAWTTATLADLSAIEPILKTAKIKIQDLGADRYTILVTSESGVVFSARKAGHRLIYTCSPASQGGCPAGGVWG